LIGTHFGCGDVVGMLTNEPFEVRNRAFRTETTGVCTWGCGVLVGSHCRYEIGHAKRVPTEATKSSR
jgi:hypothetical protein